MGVGVGAAVGGTSLPPTPTNPPRWLSLVVLLIPCFEFAAFSSERSGEKELMAMVGVLLLYVISPTRVFAEIMCI